MLLRLLGHLLSCAALSNHAACLQARAQNGMPPPTSRTQSRLQHSPLRSQQLEQEPDQQSDQQGLKGPPFTQDELEHRDAGADEGCEQVGHWACSWGTAVSRGPQASAAREGQEQVAALSLPVRTPGQP